MDKHVVDYNPFDEGELSRVAPSTEAQKEIWASVQMGDDANRSFNESVTLTLLGELDVSAMQKALQYMLERHEALRACFSPDGELICIRKQADVSFSIVDLSAFSADKKASELRRQLDLSVDTPYNLVLGPLFGARLFKMDAKDYRLNIYAHHIVCDGWSMSIIARELGSVYSEYASGGEPKLGTPGQFGDYAINEWRAADGEAYQLAEAYWKEQFKNVIPRLDFPVDRNRPPLRTYKGRRIDYQIGDTVFEGLRKLSSKAGCTFVTTLLAGFEAFLYRLTMQQNLVVGIPAAGQSATGQLQLVGHCVNLLPMHCEVAGDMRFIDLLKRVRSLMLDAYENQNYTFGSLVKQLPIARDPGRIPLMPILFNIDQVSDEPYRYQGLSVSFASNPRHYENFEITLNLAASSKKVVLECTYNTNLFDQQTIEARLREYESLLSAAANDPETSIASLPILTAEEQAALINQSTQAQSSQDYPNDQVNGDFLSLFKKQVELTPDSPVVRFGDVEIDYVTLDRTSNQVANFLLSKGVCTGDKIGVSVERSEKMLTAVLGVLKAGACYIPLDPGYPQERLSFMVQDSALSYLVSERAFAKQYEAQGVQLILLDDESAQIDLCDDTAPAVRISPEDIAYVIYTSGSTGKPKGVCVQHSAVRNFLESMQKIPGIRSGDRLLAVTTLSFDIAVLELYLPLISGASVVIASRDEAMDGQRLKQLVEQHNINMMQATPSTWRLLLSAGWVPSEDFKALCGGEAMPEDLAKTLAAGCELWNMYGPTETTVWSSCYRVPSDGHPVLIGKPIDHTQFYVLDLNGQPVPAGVAGELYIGGDGVTAGYLGREELTAERFISNGFSDDPKARLYRTGDLVRQLHDGNFEYFNRVDNQVKLRGYRIELGEIEAVINDCDQVEQAVAAVQDFSPGDQRLVAYIVSEQNVDFDTVRERLRSALPVYMVPQHFMQLPSLPLTANGKIDRKALPMPESAAVAETTELTPPASETEALILEIWSDALGTKELSVQQDFFDAGGHSLLGIQVLARIAAVLDVQIPLSKLFELSTIRTLAAYVDEEKGQPVQDGHITKLEPGQIAPLSIQQQRIWFLDQIGDGNLEYNLPAAFTLTGALDIEALKRAFETILQRQEILRSRFFTTGHSDSLNPDDTCIEIVDSIALDLEPLDLTKQCDTETAKQATIEKYLSEHARHQFDLKEGPLFYVSLAQLADDEHLLFLMPHHAVFDGWSFDILLDELSTLYSAYRRSETPELPELTVQYSDYAAWQRKRLSGEEGERLLEFWRQKLGDELPVLDLPTDYPRPAHQSHRAGSVYFELDKQTIDALSEFARREQVTVYMLILAAYTLLLSRYSGQDDILIGTPISGRNWTEINPVIGFFVNTLIIRNRIVEDKTLREFLKTVRDTTVEAFSNQDVPFERLIQKINIPRDLSRSAVFQTLFMYQDVRNRAIEFNGLDFSQVNVARAGVQTDLDFWVKRTSEGMVGAFEYCSALFSEESVRSMLDHLIYLLKNFTRFADQPLAHLSILTDESREKLTVGWNDTARPVPQDATIHGLIEQHLSERKSKTAVCFHDREVSYESLNRDSNRLARHLVELGVTANSLVGLCMSRSDRLLVAVLGILKAGGAYLPLDPEYPRDRLEFMVADSGLELILADDEIDRALPDVGVSVVKLDQLADALEAYPETDLEGRATEDDLAYVIYTSGSTGKPKGVQIPHRAAANFLLAMSQQPGLCESDTLAAVTTLSFDISVLELFLPLVVGARVVVVDRNSAADGRLLVSLLEAQGVNVMQATPATWRLLISANWQGDASFKALCGGEAMPSDLASELLVRTGELWNMYGPTETTVWSSCYRVTDDHSPILIGRPIANTQFYVLNPQGEMVSPGVKGELYIGGNGVTLGYLNRAELTAERFVEDKYAATVSGRLYRTGDLVRYRHDGNLEYLGRLDSQVKLRGFRIELGEIETVLSEHVKIKQAAVDVKEERAGDQRLAAYYLLADGHRTTATELRKHLRESLPDYMIPQHFVELEKMPLTPNGKVDKKSLPSLFGKSQIDDQYEPPSSDAEQAMAAIWRDVIGVEKIGRHDNFFDVGGHSLLAIQVVGRARDELGSDVSLRMLVSDSLSQIVKQLELPDASAPSDKSPDAPEMTSQVKSKGSLIGRLKSKVFSK